MDFVYIQDLKLKTTIGAFEWEHAIKQSLYLDLELGINALNAAHEDDIKQTIDYTAIANRVLEKFENHSCQLIETLAERIAQLILTEFPVPWLKLKIRKPGIIAVAKEVGIVIERSR